MQLRTATGEPAKPSVTVAGLSREARYHAHFPFQLDKSRVRTKLAEPAARVGIDPDHHGGVKCQALVEPSKRLVVVAHTLRWALLQAS